MEFGDFMREARSRQGVSKYRLSQVTRISVTALSGYESLKHEPTVSAAEKICKALDVQYIIGVESAGR